MSSYGSPSRSTRNRPHPYTRSQSRQIGDEASQDGESTYGDSRSGTVAKSGIPSSMSTSNLPRSGSESSLFGGLKSVLKKPFSWLATPSRGSGGTKRDLSPDAEDPPSPINDTRTKRIRRDSPSPSRSEKSDYEPKRQKRDFEVTGRAITGNMIQKDFIPPLPSNISLSTRKAGTTNFSRPLASSQSMPYLDPPSFGISSPNRKRNGMLSRSRRMNLGESGGDEDTEMNGATRETVSPSRDTTPRPRDYALPSNSPFRPLHGSPARFGSLARSSTMSNIARAQSVASDVSMGTSINRSNNLFGQRSDSRMSIGSSQDFFGRGFSSQSTGPLGRSSTMREGSVSAFPAIRNGPMVWDADRGFIRESDLRAENPGPIGANEAERILFALENRRNTPLQTARDSAVPFSQGGPFPSELVGASSRQIRKAINVPLATAQTRDTLRTKREKELQEDRQRGVSVLISPYGRRRQAEDDLRAARAAEKRQREREEEKKREHEEKARAEREKEDQVMSDRALSVPVSTRSRRTRSVSSRLSDLADEDEHMTTPRRSSRLKRGEPSPEPEPSPRSRKSRTKVKAADTPKARSTRKGSPPAETPRRSTRKTTADRGTSASPPPDVPAVSNVPTITETAPSPRQETTSGYRPRAAGEMAKERSTLRAQADKTRRAHEGAASFSNKANVPGSGRFSAKEEDLPDMDDLDDVVSAPPTSFSNISFAPLTAGPPKVSVASDESKAPSDLSGAAASGDSGSLLSRLGPKPSEQPSLSVPTSGPVSRLTQHRPRASSPLAGTSVTAQPESPPADPPAKSPTSLGGFVPLSTPSLGSTTPAGKPPANSFFSGLAASKPATQEGAPAASTLFGNIEGPKKTAGAGLGLGKPTESDKPKESTLSGIPDFFGKASSATDSSAAAAPAKAPLFNFGTSAPAPVAAPIQSSTAPAAAPMFSFGSTSAASGKELFPAKKDETSTAPAAAPFSFGKPSEPAAAASSGFSFSDSKPAPDAAVKKDAPSFSFGATAPTAETPKVDEPISNPFSFGAPASKPAETKPASGGFNFGSATPASPAAEAPKSTFSFGAPAASAPSTSSTETPKSTFSFGAPASKATSEPASAPAPTFSFGQTNTDKPAASAPPASGSSFGGFNFGKPATPAPAAAPASTGFSFGNTAAPASSTGFGGLNGNKKRANDNASTSEPPAKIGSLPGTPAVTPSTGFNFGSNTSAPAQNAMGGFGNNAGSSTFSFGSSAPQTPTSQPSNPFGGNNNATSGSSFTFGAGSSAPGSTTPAQSPAPGGTGFSFNFGSGNNGNSTGTASAPFQFGASAPSASSTGFGAPSGGGFGAGNNAPNGGGFGMAGNTNNAGGFGSNPASTGFGVPNTQSSGFGNTNAPSGGFGSNPGFGATGNNSFGGGFGQPQPAQPTTPSQAPSSGFTFGAPAASNTPSFAFGAGGGAPSSPAAGGGFSLGTAAAAPGSPSGRVIKPLRRGTKK